MVQELMTKVEQLEKEIQHANLPEVKDFETMMQDVIKVSEAHTRIDAFILAQLAEVKAELEKIEGWRL